MDRTVDKWGRVVFDPTSAFDLLYRGIDITKTPFSAMSDELVRYNAMCKRFDKLSDAAHEVTPPEHSPEEEHSRRANTWMIPEDLKEIPVREFLLSLCKTDQQRERVNSEMDMFEERGLEPVLRTMIWMIDNFRQRGVVWGVGRGSSVASLCLYLIGVHRIDPLKYGLRIEEFLR
jgi:DNA polymerase III alpha subunit